MTCVSEINVAHVDHDGGILGFVCGSINLACGLLWQSFWHVG